MSGLIRQRNLFEVSPAGLRQWVDYLPIKRNVAPGTSEDTFNDSGSIKCTMLVDNTGLKAWVDYTPVVTVATANGWRFDDTGHIWVSYP